MKKYMLFILPFLCSCFLSQNKIDIYFNSASVITKEFKIEILSGGEVLLDTILHQTTVDKYKKIARITITGKEKFSIIVNGVDSLVQNESNNDKLFIGYQDAYLYPERTDKAHDVKNDFSFDKSKHKLILQFKD